MSLGFGVGSWELGIKNHLHSHKLKTTKYSVLASSAHKTKDSELMTQDKTMVL